MIMIRKITLIFMLLVNNALAQQTSDVKIDSGSRNDISVSQQGKGAQNSGIGIKKGSENKIKVEQADTAGNPKEVVKEKR